jgi:serine protease Do
MTPSDKRSANRILTASAPRDTTRYTTRAVSGRLVLASLICLGLAAGFASVLSADEPDEQSVLPRIFRFGPERNLRNSRQVKSAFREVVANATEATVEVLCDDRRSALGAIVDADGLILTKASELSGEIKCRLNGGDTLTATLVAMIPDFDLAMLKVDARDLPVVEWTAAEPVVGSWLATPGTSAIPRAIGVVSVDARRIPNQRGMLGVRLDDPSDEKPGALVMDVVERSAADQAGLRSGDRVTHLDGSPIEGGYRGFMGRMANKHAAEVVELKVARGESTVDFKVTLMPEPALQRYMETDIEVDGKLSVHRWGFDRIIQHDTVLQPSDCGGPLVNLSGKVIGLNIARAARVASYAVPAADAIKFIAEFKAGMHLVATEVSTN